MSNRIHNIKQHIRSKFLVNEEISFFKKPKGQPKFISITNRQQNHLPLLNITNSNSNSERSILIDNTSNRTKTPNENNAFSYSPNSNRCLPGPHLLKRPIKLKTHCFKQSRMLQLKLNCSPIQNSNYNKDTESLIKITMNNTQCNIDKYEIENSYLKEATDSKGNYIFKNNKYEMKDLKTKIGEMHRKVKLIKGVCDYTCPLIFVARNNVIKINKRKNSKLKQLPNQIKESNSKTDTCVPVSLIYSTKHSKIKH